jgi:hypothetical protein
MDMREAIDGHIANVNGSVGNILSDNSNMTKAAEASKGTLSFHDNIVVAAQEHAAKHAGAFVFSCVQRQMLYRQSVWLLCLL